MVNGPCTNLQQANPPIHVRLPDGSSIASTHTGLVPLPYIPSSACRAHIFPSIKSGSLLSIGQLCDVGCIATFDKATVVVKYGNKIVTHGTRTANGLWTIEIAIPNITPKTQPTPTLLPKYVGNHLSTLETKTASDRIAFLHAAAGYPVLSTWIQAIEKGFYATWPGLTVQAVRRHLPKSIVTTMGHLDQQRKNKQSTKEKVVQDDMSTKSPPTGTSRTQHVYADALPMTGKIFSDLPGRFVVPSSRGNNYLLVVYDYDSNAIEAQPIKSRSATDIVNGFKKIVELLNLEDSVHNYIDWTTKHQPHYDRISATSTWTTS